MFTFTRRNETDWKNYFLERNYKACSKHDKTHRFLSFFLFLLMKSKAVDCFFLFLSPMLQVLFVLITTKLFLHYWDISTNCFSMFNVHLPHYHDKCYASTVTNSIVGGLRVTVPRIKLILSDTVTYIELQYFVSDLLHVVYIVRYFPVRYRKHIAI